MVHISLSLPRCVHINVMLRKYEALQAISLGEALGETGAVFPRAASEVVYHAEYNVPFGRLVMMCTHPGI
jgi:hypothetical protein